jgi:hypothetical protein
MCVMCHLLQLVNIHVRNNSVAFPSSAFNSWVLTFDVFLLTAVEPLQYDSDNFSLLEMTQNKTPFYLISAIPQDTRENIFFL